MKLQVIFGLSLMTCACSLADKGFVEQPDQYGLYVAVTNIYMDIPVQIQSDATGEVISIQTHLYGREGVYGYLEQSLKPGRYHIYSYHPYSNVSISLQTPTGYFDVQAGCLNYGGHIDFETVDNRTVYTNEVDLTEVPRLPKPISGVAKGKDLCMAPMGKPNQRITSDAAKDLFHDE